MESASDPTILATQDWLSRPKKLDLSVKLTTSGSWSSISARLVQKTSCQSHQQSGHPRYYKSLDKKKAPMRHCSFKYQVDMVEILAMNRPNLLHSLVASLLSASIRAQKKPRLFLIKQMQKPKHLKLRQLLLIYVLGPITKPKLIYQSKKVKHQTLK